MRLGIFRPRSAGRETTRSWLGISAGARGGQQPAAMTIEGNGSDLDLDAMLAARWADPQVFPATEFARAEVF